MDSSSDRWQRHWIGKVSPLARRILGFNLTALGVLIGCILWTWDTDISSGLSGDLRLLSEAEVIAEVIVLGTPCTTKIVGSMHTSCQARNFKAKQQNR